MAESQPAINSGDRPSMCRSCGAIVGGGEAVCSACGAATTAGTPRPPVSRPESERGARAAGDLYDNETVRFARAIFTRPVTFTFVFLAANVFIYLLMYLSGGAQGEVLVAYGAKVNSRIAQGGEWWRLVTPIFLHVQLPGLGPLHLLANMYGLWQLGPYVERLYGSARFVVFWVAAGVAGSVASFLTVRPDMQTNVLGRFLFRSFDAPTAGASGALFGLIGVLLVFGIKFRHELPAGFRRAFGFGMLPMVFVNVLIGYFGRGLVDNAGHMGGLAAGVLLALFVAYRRPGQPPRVAYAWHALQFAALALVVVSFGEVARRFDAPAPSFANARRDDPVKQFIDAYNSGQRAFERAVGDADAAAADEAVAKIGRAPRLDEGSHLLLEELKALLAGAGAYARLGEGGRDGPDGRARKEKLLADFAAWESRADSWARAEGDKYNLTLGRPEEAEGQAPEAGGGGEPAPPGGAATPGGPK
ncbi:MAG: rhomboid family intramembrane serine protease [Acidobacteria bacterium]|nr:rhomboid family intramembrane serine protease [Acidobacteriota bacterium]